MLSAPAIHQTATTGFGNANAYDKHRPTYPFGAVQELLEKIDVAGKTGAKLVDLAAGTGKLTEVLAARTEGFRILAVEPHASMRQTLEEKNLKGVETKMGTAEDMGVEDGWADAVVVAQAFHWFATLEALAEVRRVLKPGGKLAMIWNVEDWNKPKAWPAASRMEQDLNDLMHESQTDGQPSVRNDDWREVFNLQTDLFSTPLGRGSREWTVWLEPEALFDRMRTISHVALLEGKDLKEFRTRFDEALLREGAARWNERGEVAVHGVTAFWWTARL